MSIQAHNPPSLKPGSIIPCCFKPILSFHGRAIHLFLETTKNKDVIYLFKRIATILLAIPLYLILGVIALPGFFCSRKVSVTIPTPNASTPISIITSAPIPIIPHENNFFIDGYESQKLELIQKIIAERNIPLHVCPKIPHTSHPPDQEKAEAYLTLLPEPHKTVCRKLLRNIRHISMDKFQLELTNCISKFKRLVGSQKYTVGLAIGKSSQWVTSLALKNLEDNLPESWFSLGHQSTDPALLESDTYVPNFPLNAPTSGDLPLVIFDDCCYSGSQMVETLIRIENHVSAKTKIFVIVPFLSNLAQTRITERYREAFSKKKQTNLEVALIFSETIPLAHDGLNRDETGLIGEFMRDPPSMSQTLCYNDWRFPDAVSFPEGIGNHRMLKRLKRRYEHSVTEESLLPKEMYFLPNSGDIPRIYSLTNVVSIAERGT